MPPQAFSLFQVPSLHSHSLAKAQLITIARARNYRNTIIARHFNRHSPLHTCILLNCNGQVTREKWENNTPFLSLLLHPKLSSRAQWVCGTRNIINKSAIYHDFPLLELPDIRRSVYYRALSIYVITRKSPFGSLIPASKEKIAWDNTWISSRRFGVPFTRR